MYVYVSLLLFVQNCLHQSRGYVGRRASASPATGYPKLHNAEQEALVKAPAASCSIASADGSWFLLIPFEGFAIPFASCAFAPGIDHSWLWVMLWLATQKRCHDHSF